MEINEVPMKQPEVEQKFSFKVIEEKVKRINRSVLAAIGEFKISNNIIFHGQDQPEECKNKEELNPTHQDRFKLLDDELGNTLKYLDDLRFKIRKQSDFFQK